MRCTCCRRITVEQIQLDGRPCLRIMLCGDVVLGWCRTVPEALDILTAYRVTRLEEE